MLVTLKRSAVHTISDIISLICYFVLFRWVKSNWLWKTDCKYKKYKSVVDF